MGKWRETDQTLVWALSGIISTAVFADGYSIVLKLLGALNFYSWNLAADFIIQGRQEIISFYGGVIGIVANYLLGALNGTLIGLFLEWRGNKHYWLKGIGVALTNWIALGIMTQVVPRLFTYRITTQHFVLLLIGYVLIGAAIAYLINLSQRLKFLAS